MDATTILVENEDGESREYEILFTFDHDDKSYVLYYDPDDESGEVYASIYDDEGHLFEIETAPEWDLISDMFEAFMAETDDE